MFFGNDDDSTAGCHDSSIPGRHETKHGQLLSWIDFASCRDRYLDLFLRQFFLTIPRDLEDAATIDGCGPLRTLVNVFLPLTKPAIATIAVFSFMWSWNNYFWPLLVISEPEMRTVQLGLAMFKSEGGIQWGEFMAATVVATLPIMIAYFIAQRQFVKGITLTGLKG